MNVRRKRVLRVVASADPRTGGPIEALKASSCALENFGWDTSVVTLDSAGEDFLKSFPFTITGLGSWRLPYRYNPRLANWIAANASDFSAVIIEGLWNHATIGGAIGAKKAGLPYYVFSHGMMDPFFRRQKPVKHWIKQLYWTLFQGRLLADAEAVLFTCEQERMLARGSFLGHAYREKVIRFGIADIPVAAGSGAGSNPAKGRDYILYMGRIDPKKGCDMLVEAFCSVADLFPELDLVIAGPDHIGLQATLTARAQALGHEERIHWTGMITGREKWDVIKGAKVFVLPSHQENFGLVVAEAMASHTAVLLTKRVNIWQEVVESGGGIADEDTIDGIRRLLLQWLSLPSSERERMRAAARAGYEKYFRIEGSAEDIATALNEPTSVTA